MNGHYFLKNWWFCLKAFFLGCLLIYFIVLSLAGKAYAASDICIPTYDGVTGRPTIDGNISDDVGWTNATRVNLGRDGGVEYRANLRLSKDSNAVFIGVESKRPIGGSASMDLLILRIYPPFGPKWHIQLQPFAGEGGAVQVWLQDEGSSEWINKTVSPGNWLHTKMVAEINGDMWFLEMEIPRINSPTPIDVPDPLGPGIYFDPGAVFGFYINVLNSMEYTLPATTIQAAWPNDVIIEGTININDMVAFDSHVDQMADVSLSSRDACTGVSLDRHAIGTTNIPDSKIKLYQPDAGSLSDHCPPSPEQGLLTNIENVFKALPENNMATDAKDVFITYKIATWGIPPLDDKEWFEIGSSGEHDISPTPSPIPLDTFHVPWAPTYDESCTFLEHTHQCMVAIMSSTDVNTRFLNDSARRNMDFVTASKFERSAEISAVGYGVPPEGQNDKHEFLLSVKKTIQRYEKRGRVYIPVRKKTTGLATDKNVASRRPSKSELEELVELRRLNPDIVPIPMSVAGNNVQEAMTWITRGYLKTGNYITIGNKRFLILQDVGGFGYVVSHDGKVDEWGSTLTGNDLESIQKDTLYSISIPPGEMRTINTRIEAIQPRSFRGCFGLF
ncbi:hypothetical protein [uncultured Desulfobacter sp.]|uniref:hypothetical protein n=1 Tax=uncultured Desulfobacter sp. TaxID=240139 RepID=UPI002AA8AD6C|nr:hypothetical protein [uncultured Desulfobacter sp.]